MRKLIIFILFYVSAIRSQSLYRYEVIVDHLELPTRDELFDYGTVRVRKYNRTAYVISGYVDLLIPFSDEIMGRFTLCSYQGNEYRKYGEQNVKKMCTYFRNDKTIFAKLMEKTSLDVATSTCPLGVQRLHFYDAYVPSDILPVQLPPGEKYRLDILYALDGKTMSNFSVYFLLKKIDNGRVGGPAFG